MVELDPMTSPFTLLQKEEVPFELKLVGISKKRILNKA
jgi:hypothetical protein